MAWGSPSVKPQWGSIYLGGVCAYNGAIAQALAQGANINTNWALYQLNMLLEMLKLSMIHGSTFPIQLLQKLYNQTLELIKGLQYGTLKPGPTLNQKLKTLTEGIEGTLNCIPEPVKFPVEGAESGPAGPVPGPLLPTGIVLLYPEMSEIPPDLPLIPQWFDPPQTAMPGQPTVPSEPEPEPKEPGFNPYSPYVQGMCDAVQKAIKIINDGVHMMNVVMYINSSIGAYLSQCYNLSVSMGYMGYAQELLKLMKLFENIPTPNEFLAGWNQGKYEEMKADILKTLQDAGLAVCIEIPPVKPADSSDLDYVPVVDFPLLPWSPEETVGEPESPVPAFPLNFGGIDTSVVAIPLYVPPPTPEEKPINPYNPVLPGLCSGVQHLIDLLNEGKLNLYYGMGYVHSMILPPLLMALTEAKAQGNQAKYDELMKIYKLFYDLPTPQKIQYSVKSQYQAKEMLAKVLKQLESISEAVCLEKPPLHYGFTPDKVKQTTPVGVGGVVAIAVLGICGLIGCGVTVFGGLPLVGIELPGFGPTACADGECASEIGTLQCGATCDPEAGGCADGLTCALMGYQGAGMPTRYVCWDNNGTCSDGTHQAGSCWAPCNGGETSTVQCDTGLSCTLWGSSTNGSYVCFSAQDCQTVTPTASSGQPALPQNPCQCEGVDFICKNGDGSIASASYNSTECGGSGNCECRGQDLFCPDGSYGQFNPACMGGGSCECIYTDPCTGGIAGCPGYYDTCSGAVCRP